MSFIDEEITFESLYECIPRSIMKHYFQLLIDGKASGLSVTSDQVRSAASAAIQELSIMPQHGRFLDAVIDWTVATSPAVPDSDEQRRSGFYQRGLNKSPEEIRDFLMRTSNVMADTFNMSHPPCSTAAEVEAFSELTVKILQAIQSASEQDKQTILAHMGNLSLDIIERVVAAVRYSVGAISNQLSKEGVESVRVDAEALVTNEYLLAYDYLYPLRELFPDEPDTSDLT